MGLGGGALGADLGAQTGLAASGTRVSGRLEIPDGRAFDTAAATLTRQAPDGPAPGVPAARLFPVGAFFFVGVAPGHYLLQASGRPEGSEERLCGTQSIQVGDTSVSGVVVTLTPCAVISGQARFDSRGSAPPADLSRVTVRADTADVEASYAGHLFPDGTFRLEGLMTGSYRLRIDDLPSPWRLEAVNRGGQDTSQAPLQVAAGGRVDDVTLVISDTAGDPPGSAGGMPPLPSLVR